MPFPNPETSAIALLRQTDQTEKPVNLDSLIALWPELNVSFEHLDSSDRNHQQAGYLIDLGIHGAEIIVRAQDSPARRRFTIAHELGHWVLRTSDEPTLKTGIGETRDPVVEKWCNDFAGALLMPQPWIQDWAVGYLKHAKLSDFIQDLLSEPDAFRVSHEAFRIRIARLTPISIFEFEWENRLVLLRSYTSEKVPTEVLSKTLSHAFPFLLKKHDAGQFFHRETGLIFAIHRFDSSQNRAPRWLICIVPETRMQKQMRLQRERTFEMRNH